MPSGLELPQKTIVLVGIMGSGKTTCGKALATLTGKAFFDSDYEIQRSVKASVAEIFEKSGEAEFRRLEKETMLRLLNDDTPKVIAAGGGGFIQDDIRDKMKKAAISIWLKSDIKVLAERISCDKERPLLRGGSIEDKLRELMHQRDPVYAEADIAIVTDGQTPQDIARRIVMEVDRRFRK